MAKIFVELTEKKPVTTKSEEIQTLGLIFGSAEAGTPIAALTDMLDNAKLKGATHITHFRFEGGERQWVAYGQGWRISPKT